MRMKARATMVALVPALLFAAVGCSEYEHPRDGQGPRSQGLRRQRLRRARSPRAVRRGSRIGRAEDRWQQA